MTQLLSKKPAQTTSKESSAVSKTAEFSGTEIRSGLLVIATIATLAALLILAGKAQFFSPMAEREVIFNYIGGLEKNAPVHFSGHKAGKVTKITFMPETHQLKLHIQIEKSIVLKEDSQAYIDTLGFMGEKFLEVTQGSAEAAPLAEDAVLKGTDPIPMMEMLKRANQIATEFEETNDHLKKLAKDLGALVESNKPTLDDTFTNLNAASKNLKDMTHDLKLHPWKLLKKDKSGEKKKKFLII